MRLILRVLRRHWLVMGLVAAVYSLDQASKFAVSQGLELGRSWPAEGFFRITHSYNTGSAFGLFPGQNAPLILVALVGIGVLAWVYRSQPNPSVWLRSSLGLQLAGALGNLTDRLTIGHVVDFIDVGPWPIFNVADSSLMVGVALLAWLLLSGSVGRQRLSTSGPSAQMQESTGQMMAEPSKPLNTDEHR